MSEQILPVEKVEIGIKEIKEALIGVNELLCVLVPAFKDGAQLSDVTVLIDGILKKEDVMDKIQAAFDRVSAIGPELKDIGLSEGLELAVVQMDYIKKLVEILRKQP